MKVSDKRWVIARNDWCANRIAERISKGLAPSSLLFPTEKDARSALTRLPAMRQEERNVYQVRIARRL